MTWKNLKSNETKILMKNFEKNILNENFYKKSNKIFRKLSIENLVRKFLKKFY